MSGDNVHALFRREALQAQESAALGEIVLMRTPASRILTWFAVLAVLAVIAFLCLGEYTRRVRLSGYLAPQGGLIAVTAPQPGVLRSLAVREGAQVKRGDVLYVLSSEHARGEAGSSEAAVVAARRLRADSLRQDLDGLGARQQRQREAVQRRIAAAQMQLRSLDASLNLAEQDLALASKGLDLYGKLRGSKAVSELDLERVQQLALEKKSTLETLRRERTAASDTANEAQQELADLPAKQKIERGALERDLAALDEALVLGEAQREITITAPLDAEVAAVLTAPGQSVSASQTLLHLVPTDSPLQAALLAPSEAVGLVHAGQAVNLRFAAFPFEQFGHQEGAVSSITHSALRAEDMPFAPPSTEPLYRIDVSLPAQTLDSDGHTHALRAGMRVEADVLLERRRLIQWLFAPLYAAANR